MNKQEVGWFSPSLHRDMRVRVYGSGEVPFLVFPTQAAMSDNFENFGMIDALTEDIDSGRIQLFCVDSVDSSPEHPVFNRAVALKDSFKAK